MAPTPQTPQVDPTVITPQVDPSLKTQGIMSSTATGEKISPTGLTATETALLSNEEKAMRLRQRGLA